MSAASWRFALLLTCWAGHAQAFDGIRVTLLGTHATAASTASVGVGTLVEAGDQILLFDGGEDVAQRLDQAGVPPKDLDAVFLTHLQPQQTTDVHKLWFSGLTRYRNEPLLVYGPRGTSEMLQSGEQAGAGGVSQRADGSPETAVDAHDIEENVIYRTEQVTVTAFVVDHGPIKPAYGFRVDYRAQRAIVLSGATRYSENLVHNARGVQLLVHEVAAANERALESSQELRDILATHSSPEDAARVFRAARPYLAVLSQILAFDVSDDEILRRTRATYRGPVELGRDQMVIEIQRELQIRNAPSEPRRARE